MDRAVKEYTTSGGRKYTMVEYITGGEGRTLGFMAIGSKSIEDQEQLHDTMIGMCVKSLDDSQDNVLQRVKDLKMSEYKEIIDKSTELFAGLDDQKKTT